MPLTLRREKQREMLRKYAPSVNVEHFLAENPILAAEAARKGCLGVVLFALAVPIASILGLWFFALR